MRHMSERPRRMTTISASEEVRLGEKVRDQEAPPVLEGGTRGEDDDDSSVVGSPAAS